MRTITIVAFLPFHNMKARSWSYELVWGAGVFAID